jgi:ABC-type Mn2+/Zn2+ transport system permease subunit
MLGWLADPWQDPILRRAFLEVVLLGVTSGAIGCWVVLYNLSYSAESLSHAMLPGLVVAALAGFPLLLGGAVGIVAAALGVAVAGRIAEIGRDTAVAVVVTALFGLGVLLALSPDTPPRLQDLLFGDVLGVTDGDLALAAALAVVGIGSLALLHGRLLLVGFDRVSAPALGVRPGVVDAALLLLLALVLLVAVRALGNLLVVAVLVAPAAAARLVAHRMAPMLATSSAIAIAGGWAGLYVSFHAGTAAGASIAGVLVAAYLLAALSSGSLRRSRAARSRALPHRT